MGIDQIVRRPTEYLGDSGLTTLVPGSGFVFLGISQLIWPMVARRHPDAALIVQFAGVGFAGLGLLALWWLKQRVVFPRSGYALPQPRPSSLLPPFLAFAGVFLVWLLFRGGHQAFDLGHLLTVPSYIALFVAFAAALEKTRLGYLFSGYLICLGVALLYLRPDMFVRESWLQIGIGAPMAVYGAIRMRRFMEENPVATGE